MDDHVNRINKAREWASGNDTDESRDVLQAYSDDRIRAERMRVQSQTVAENAIHTRAANDVRSIVDRHNISVESHVGNVVLFATDRQSHRDAAIVLKMREVALNNEHADLEKSMLVATDARMTVLTVDGEGTEHFGTTDVTVPPVLCPSVEISKTMQTPKDREFDSLVAGTRAQKTNPGVNTKLRLDHEIFQGMPASQIYGGVLARALSTTGLNCMDTCVNVVGMDANTADRLTYATFDAVDASTWHQSVDAALGDQVPVSCMDQNFPIPAGITAKDAPALRLTMGVRSGETLAWTRWGKLVDKNLGAAHVFAVEHPIDQSTMVDIVRACKRNDE